MSHEELALEHAERHGIYPYKVVGNLMKWISYFGNEGFYKVTYNLDTKQETRKHQKTTRLEYNYFCG